jgi:DNA-binding transcriptional ArsR family regulator
VAEPEHPAIAPPAIEHPAIESLDVTVVLSALSDPARLAIVRQLATSMAESTCQSVAVDMPKSTRSHHLKVLRESGVVHMTLRGREKVLRLRRDDLEGRWPGLLGAVLVEKDPVEKIRL